MGVSAKDVEETSRAFLLTTEMMQERLRQAIFGAGSGDGASAEEASSDSESATTSEEVAISVDDLIAIAKAEIKAGIDGDPGYSKIEGFIDRQCRFSAADLLEKSPDDILRLSALHARAFDALKFAVASALERRDAIPTNILTWVAGVLRGEIPCPPKKRGRKEDIGRNFYIHQLVQQLDFSYGVLPTRNDATDTICGCDIVRVGIG